MSTDDPTQICGVSGVTDELTQRYAPADASTRMAGADDRASQGGPLRWPASASLPHPSRPSPGTVIRERFVLEALLGAGGMGNVYLALDKRKQEAQDPNPTVAIKLLSGDFAAHPKAFIQLQRETRKSQQLAHPNIVTVYDFDRDDQRAYMTMEALRGRTLDAIIRDHPEGLPAQEVHTIVDGMSQGLRYAHAKDIVHADLKPSNVFVCDDGTVKLLDFGIARAVHHAAPITAASAIEAQTDPHLDGLTDAHVNGRAPNLRPAETVAVGKDSAHVGSGDYGLVEPPTTVFDAAELGGLTPSYASLAMFAGEAPTPADDLYAMGIITIELLTGQHPFERLSAPDAKAQALVPTKPTGISNRQWRALRAALSLDEVAPLNSVGAFRQLYFGRPIRAWAASIAVGLVATTALLTWLLAPSALPEAVPFNTLPVAVQEQVTTHLAKAREAWSFGDVNAVLFHLGEVHELHTYNADASALRDDVVEATVDQLVGIEIVRQREQLAALLNYPLLQNNVVLRARLDELSGEL